MNLAFNLDNIQSRVSSISMREIFNRKNLEKLTHHVGNVNNVISMNRKSNYNSKNYEHANKHDKVLKFDMTFEKYLTEIENITSRRLHPSQRIKLKETIENHEYKRLSSDETHKNRKKFGSDRSRLIEEWENMTGNKWPTYEKPVYSNKGAIVRQIGSKYDAHEIILNSWGSPHESWNIHPARFFDEHQNNIHRHGGMADQIFG